MLVLNEDTRAQVAVVGPGGPDGAPNPTRTRRPAPLSLAGPVLAMAAGVAVVAVAVLILVHVRPAASSGVTLGGPSDVTVQSSTYEPGQRSDWHSHPGMHAVMVVSGTLTIFDGQCRPRTFGPGDVYVGGRDIHLATNQTALPVVMTVTYMFPAGVPHTAFHVPATPPAGCDVG